MFTDRIKLMLKSSIQLKTENLLYNQKLNHQKITVKPTRKNLPRFTPNLPQTIEKLSEVA